ncbi:hypothetical protein ACFOWE_05535 [Planomonospora corallina]|uniref:Uncharacterized protein n=1 Tax=Planomonospora corallina TaxID=1806052 RepID=A0ABV8I4A3_9ACTN
MGFPGDSPRRQPYVQPDGPSRPPFAPGAPQRPPAWGGRPDGQPDGQPDDRPDGQGESWFGAPSPGHAPRQPDPGPADAPRRAPQPEPPYPGEPARRPGTFEDPGSAGASGGAGASGKAGASRGAGRPKKADRTPRPAKQPWSPYEEGPRALLPTFVAIGVVGVLIAGGVGLAVFAGSGDDSPPGAGDVPAPAAADPAIPANPGGVFGFAEARKTDPHKLALDELFKSKKVRVKGQDYAMTVQRHDKKCKDAAVGATLQKALTQGRCNQFLRASFRDASGKVIGTVGVANLETSAAAAKVVKAVGGKKGSKEYLKVLPGKDKVTKFLGTGEAFVGGWRHGHYAVLVWFQYKDGHMPNASEKKKLNAAAFGVVDATVTPALESRSLTGKRP